MPAKKKSKTEGDVKEEDKVQSKEAVEAKESEKGGNEAEVDEDIEKEEKDMDEDDGDKAPTKAVTTTRGKRKREFSNRKSYEPEDFTLTPTKGGAKASPVVVGRGTALSDLESVKASIEKCITEDLPFAYRFLFGPRGKVTKKEMKNNLLEFNGYLPPLPKGKKLSEEELEDYDKDYEVRPYKDIRPLRHEQENVVACVPLVCTLETHWCLQCVPPILPHTSVTTTH
jgi:hypothetical protein